MTVLIAVPADKMRAVVRDTVETRPQAKLVSTEKRRTAPGLSASLAGRRFGRHDRHRRCG
ncbi:MAG: hypothetical protein WDN69_32075 [Aliidongia sp.]